VGEGLGSAGTLEAKQQQSENGEGSCAIGPVGQSDNEKGSCAVGRCTEGTGAEGEVASINTVFSQLQLVVGDGGFKIGKDEDGRHMEHLQELFSYRVVLSEFLVAFRSLFPGGAFVCKIFDCFSHATASLIFLAAHLFESVLVIKPTHSRAVNSERYVVCKGMTSDAGRRAQITQALQRAHARAFSGAGVGASIVKPQAMQADHRFSSSLRAMVTRLCTSQITALQTIMNKVDTEITHAQYKADCKVAAARLAAAQLKEKKKLQKAKKREQKKQELQQRQQAAAHAFPPHLAHLAKLAAAAPATPNVAVAPPAALFGQGGGAPLPLSQLQQVVLPSPSPPLHTNFANGVPQLLSYPSPVPAAPASAAVAELGADHPFSKFLHAFRQSSDPSAPSVSSNFPLHMPVPAAVPQVQPKSWGRGRAVQMRAASQLTQQSRAPLSFAGASN